MRDPRTIFSAWSAVDIVHRKNSAPSRIFAMSFCHNLGLVSGLTQREKTESSFRFCSTLGLVAGRFSGVGSTGPTSELSAGIVDQSFPYHSIERAL